MIYTNKSEIINTIENFGYSLVDDNLNNLKASHDLIDAYDKDGYYYQIYWYNIRKGYLPLKFHKRNLYTIRNINRFLENMNMSDYICISESYENNHTPLMFLHKKCGKTFEASLVQISGKWMRGGYKYYKRCPHCECHLKESLHASILKQVFLHTFPDTITEEKSCINPKTNRILPTDIVNHRMKIAIEVQSHFHDNICRKEIDKYKKSFWENKGYKFYNPDIRDYTILGMIQIFFKEISEIPSYVDYSFSKHINYVKVQPMLDIGYSIKEIEKELNYNNHYVHTLLQAKKVSLPNNYKEKILNIRPIVQVSKKDELIERFESKCEADRMGFAYGTISRVLAKKQKFAYNTCWFYEDEYLIGNYEIPSDDFDHFTLAVSKFDMNDNFIKSYESIYAAEKDSKSNRHEIFRVANGIHKSSRKEKWKFISN